MVKALTEAVGTNCTIHKDAVGEVVAANEFECVVEFRFPQCTATGRYTWEGVEEVDTVPIGTVIVAKRDIDRINLTILKGARLTVIACHGSWVTVRYKTKDVDIEFDSSLEQLCN